MAVNLTTVNLQNIRQNFERVRLLGTTFKQSKLFRSSNNFHNNFERIKHYYIHLSTIFKMAN